MPRVSLVLPLAPVVPIIVSFGLPVAPRIPPGIVLFVFMVRPFCCPRLVDSLSSILWKLVCLGINANGRLVSLQEASVGVDLGLGVMDNANPQLRIFATKHPKCESRFAAEVVVDRSEGGGDHVVKFPVFVRGGPGESRKVGCSHIFWYRSPTRP